MLDEGVTEVENCKRELEEETGFTSDDIEYVSESIIENYFRGSIKYYIARDCYRLSDQNLEDGEEITVFQATVGEFESMILSGHVASSKTAYLFLLVRRK